MSEIRATTISDAAGTGPITLTKQSAAKAWINCYSMNTAAIRDSFNVSSITDLGVGNINMNLSSAMSTSFNYSVSLSGEHHSQVALGFAGFCSPINATLCSLRSTNVNGAYFDNAYLFGSTHGDLA